MGSGEIFNQVSCRREGSDDRQSTAFAGFL